MILLIEGIVMCFILLIYCVIGIANGPVGLVVLYEEDVQARVVELGLTTKEKIRKSFIISCAALFLPVVTVTPAFVYVINGAAGFRDGFWQMTVILLIMGLFDRFLSTGTGSGIQKRGLSQASKICSPTFRKRF